MGCVVLKAPVGQVILDGDQTAIQVILGQLTEVAYADFDADVLIELEGLTAQLNFLIQQTKLKLVT